MCDTYMEYNDGYYFGKCPHCGEFFSMRDREMNWEEESEIYTCDKCGDMYSITPEYQFKGFVVKEEIPY